MTYQVLARKWRPRSFATLVGQEHVVRALTHALEAQRLHHAYLFTGTRGVGKTTIARILAKSLNCESGITPTPCGKCAACTEIDAGRFVDLLEVDAATNTRVDEMRQLLENAIYSPTRGRFKVYVIDEVHMLSNAAFNAMLKTLEEPPEHVKFILATTDPQKIPVTVLSRCLQFNLKQMAPASIREHLQRILGEEGIPGEPAALALIAQAANGSMRDALSLLDQAIAYSGSSVAEDAVRGMLGTVDRGYLFDILEAIVARDLKRAVGIAADMEARSIGFDGALLEFGTILHRVALAHAGADILPEDTVDRVRLVDLAARVDPETVQLMYQIVIHGRAELSLAPDQLAGFTMTLIRMATFWPDDSGSAVGEQSARAPASALPRDTGRASLAHPGGVVAAATLSVRPRDVSPVARSTERPSAPAVTPVARPATRVPRESVAPADAEPAMPGDAAWPELVRMLPLSGFAKQLGDRSELVSRSANRFVLRLSPAAKQLANYQDKLRSALEQHLGAPAQIEIVVSEVGGATVAAQDQARRDGEMKAAQAAIDADPFVRDIVSDLGATIESVRPLSG